MKEGTLSVAEGEVAGDTQADVLNSQLELIVWSLGEELWDGSANPRAIILRGVENGHVILRSEKDSGPGGNPGGHEN